MTVRDIMRPNPLTLKPEDTLSTASQLMAWGGIRHLPVLDGGRLVGILSERDLLRHRDRVDPPEGGPRVASAMQRQVKTLSPDAPIIEAADRMAEHKIGCLPVVDRGKLVGLVTTTDVLLNEVRSAFSGSGPRNSQLTARDVMSPDPTTTRPDEHLAQVVARMSLARTRHLPVVDEQGKLVGMISDRDLGLVAVDLGGPFPRFRDDRQRASSIMQRDVRSVGPEATIAELIALLTDWRMSAVPVVEGGDRLVGIVSYVDVLRTLAPR